MKKAAIELHLKKTLELLKEESDPEARMAEARVIEALYWVHQASY
jgi:hypothetical protein